MLEKQHKLSFTYHFTAENVFFFHTFISGANICKVIPDKKRKKNDLFKFLTTCKRTNKTGFRHVDNINIAGLLWFSFLVYLTSPEVSSSSEPSGPSGSL